MIRGAGGVLTAARVFAAWTASQTKLEQTIARVDGVGTSSRRPVHGLAVSGTVVSSVTTPL